MQDGPPPDQGEPLPFTEAGTARPDDASGSDLDRDLRSHLDAALADALPAHGEVIADARGGGRWLRVTWHHEADVVVLSQWREGLCVGTVRLARADVPLMVNALVEGLADEGSTPGRRRRQPDPS
ncbi:MAG: hypothetical protein ACXV3C_00845 [Actinomycetes bacterium]